VTTPGFTAETSLYRARGHYRQISYTPAAGAELLRLAVLPTHGKWCGDTRSGPGIPEDAVDEVCCRHDQCYCENGDLECKCDRDLLADMPAAIADPETTAGARAYGLAAIAFFAVSPCVCWREICYPNPFTWPPYSCSEIPVPGLPGLKVC
jgi:hypothetical protein